MKYRILSQDEMEMEADNTLLMSGSLDIVQSQLNGEGNIDISSSLQQTPLTGRMLPFTW